jgi:hypothetical protein
MAEALYEGFRHSSDIRGIISKAHRTPEWVSKTLAILNAISGYTFASLALAGAFVQGA